VQTFAVFGFWPTQPGRTS